jgi:DNA-binding MarR family transcriptional regulator
MAQILTGQKIEPAVLAWTRLVRAYAATRQVLESELRQRHGLTIKGYEALLVLSHAEDGRMKRVDLARSLMLTPSGITRLLQGLEEAGFVERAACASDLRVTYAQLTAAGREKLHAAAEGHDASIRALFGEYFADGEVEAVAEILGKLPGVAGGDDSCSPG